MFGLMKNLYAYMKKRKDRMLTLVLVGLDNAGKSTLLANLRGVAQDNVTPTWGFNSESLMDGKVKMDIYDLGGGKNIRKIWERYYAEVHGAVYVIDAADKERLEEAKNELLQMLRDAHVSGKPVLIFANKQDLPAALGAADIAAALDLSSIEKTRYQIVPCTARTPEGAQDDPALRKGVKWLIQQIESDYSKLAVRVEQEAAKQREEEERKKAERKARVEAARAERKRAQEAAEKEAAANEAAAAAADASSIVQPATPQNKLEPLKLEPLSNGKEVTFGADGFAEPATLVPGALSSPPPPTPPNPLFTDKERARSPPPS
mmetsp:Transcript_33686/g.73553  ORF Transcript_33686/g.73553 Transcript_33686/m.73553 type:complete len:319 (-) Transcript_33686:280-1236(-)